MSDLKTRFLGICPVCLGEFKLTSGNLVHHGYKRPGNLGHIVGDCFGVGYPAYQRSKQGCIEYQAAVRSQLERETNTLVSIDSGEAKEAWVKRRTSFGQSTLVKVTSEDPKFTEALQTFRTMVVYAIRDCNREIERMDNAIAGWVLKDVRTVEESVREKDTQKAAREAEREVKRAAARAKAAERAEIVKKRKAQREALIATYRAKFIQFADGLESARDRKEAARWDWVQMQKAMSKSAYLHFYAKDLDCDEALKKLGLAEVRERPVWGIPREGTPTTYVCYADRDGFLR